MPRPPAGGNGMFGGMPFGGKGGGGPLPETGVNHISRDGVLKWMGEEKGAGGGPRYPRIQTVEVEILVAVALAGLA